jgi:hypothetical protein
VQHEIGSFGEGIVSNVLLEWIVSPALHGSGPFKVRKKNILNHSRSVKGSQASAAACQLVRKQTPQNHAVVIVHVSTP